MEPEAALFGLGCAATIAFGAAARDRMRLFLAIVLMMMWAASNIGWLMDALGYLPIMDLPFALLVTHLWHVERQGWQLALAALAVTQLILHVDYAVFGRDFELTYLALLDLTFGLQLFAVSQRGIGNVGGHLHRWLRMVRLDRRSPSRGEVSGG